jgi:hypothetical protein
MRAFSATCLDSLLRGWPPAGSARQQVILEGILASKLHGQIAQAVRDGTDIDDIQRTIIDPAPIAEDEKSALWLYAQALHERPALHARPGQRQPGPLHG